MREITIVTPTYNRVHTLPRLYESLKAQEDGDFTWLVVDDGSDDGTEDLLRCYIEAGEVDMEVLSQPNGGKARALNLAFGQLKGTKLAAVVDSDDWLLPTAVVTIRKNLQDYGELENLGGFFFHYQKADGQVMQARRPLEAPKLLSRLAYNRLHGKNDGCNCYHRNTFQSLRYPEFEGEKYIGPTVLQLMMDLKGLQFCYSPTVIGVSEYLEDGLSKSGRKLRVDNPLGMAIYCKYSLSKTTPLCRRLANATQGHAYLFLSGLGRFVLQDLGLSHVDFGPLTLIPGYILSLYWIRRYAPQKSARKARQ